MVDNSFVNLIVALEYCRSFEPYVDTYKGFALGGCRKELITTVLVSSTKNCLSSQGKNKHFFCL